jgi:hypothetical protein
VRDDRVLRREEQDPDRAIVIRAAVVNVVVGDAIVPILAGLRRRRGFQAAGGDMG